ncbi:MAG: hypothetical protein EXR63_05655 [Dehalococcoidia bacterium]|nr:hypothetical protein [Dehalococcoidia bacterium]
MRPALLIVGAVTRDVVVGQGDQPMGERAGGAASYAARAATALGVRAAILTIAAPDADLDALAGHDVTVVPADTTLTFEHTHGAAGARALRLLARPQRALTWADLPAQWRAADAFLLAPLLPDDIDVASFARVDAPLRGLLAQGLQRRVAEGGAVHSLDAPSPVLLAALSPSVAAQTTVFLSAEETAAWSAADRDALAACCARVVLTQGAAGALVHASGVTHNVPPAPAIAVDATGAGDVFATALILGLSARDAAAEQVASMLAAASVARYGPAPLPTRAELEGTNAGTSEAETGQR